MVFIIITPLNITRAGVLTFYFTGVSTHHRHLFRLVRPPLQLSAIMYVSVGVVPLY